MAACACQCVCVSVCLCACVFVCVCRHGETSVPESHGTLSLLYFALQPRRVRVRGEGARPM